MIYVAPEYIYKKQFSTDKVDKSRHAQQRNLSFNFISMQNTVLATRMHWKNDLVFSSLPEICETRLLCVCSCSLPHPTTPCAVSIAGWSWYNCTCFKHALKLHSLYFPSPQCVHSYTEKEKRRAHCVQPAMLFTNHSGFPTFHPSLLFSSLPPSLCTPTKEKKKKCREKKC